MEIAEGVYAIGQTGRNAYPSGYSQAYLLDDEETGLTLIDTLSDPDAGPIVQQLKKLKRSVADINRIVLTHAHRSHVRGAAALKALSGAAVYCHEWEAPIVSGERKAAAVSLRPIPPLRTYPQRIGLALGVAHPPCAVDRYLYDGQKVGPVRAIHTPGHTPGHVAFYWPERRALFTGDKIVTWPELGAGWPGFQADEARFRDSMRYMERSVIEMSEDDSPPVDVLGVAHGDPITRGAAERLRILVGQAGG